MGGDERSRRAEEIAVGQVEASKLQWGDERSRRAEGIAVGQVEASR